MLSCPLYVTSHYYGALAAVAYTAKHVLVRVRDQKSLMGLMKGPHDPGLYSASGANRSAELPHHHLLLLKLRHDS